MRHSLILVLVCLLGHSELSTELRRVSHAAERNGAASICAPVGSSELVITTTNRLAGAIDSVKWNGQEFINSTDHGRQLQSACSFDCAKTQPFWAECYNPTEAGSRADGAGDQYVPFGTNLRRRASNRRRS